VTDDAAPTTVDGALVEEACKKSSMLWLRPRAGVGTDRSVPAWHVWHDGAVFLVSGGREQSLPELGDGAEVEVTVRSKDKGSRLVTFVAAAQRVTPGDDAWESAVAELHAKRLNPPDGEGQPARWARESTVTRLTPTGRVTEAPGRMPKGSGRAEPPDSPATTRGPLPFVIGRRASRRR
jgi:hypothetical protein